ncbi:hypothetical protein B0T14DRAFT_460860 [Immersiella caudata]|uniref:Xylanolytic transcriptional activator regulatory domain-containing protein n=1 Tax=Immersiella caudata TaxID=314043 RepID=A0AA40BY03_9PEZI|nr:hypothetical protein B0T14DRAFT_460860 [Immersiella caudata]
MQSRQITATCPYTRTGNSDRVRSSDNGTAEEGNLSLPSIGSGSESPESRIKLDRRTTCAKLSVTMRDRIVAMVAKTCKAENLIRAVSSFPSVKLLDTLVQYYLTSPITQADSFLHAATFDPNRKRPELLAAMAAAGAVLTADPALTKLGLAIQECIRAAVPLMWEADNSTIRDLELSQAYFIALEIGLWSGLSRKVEIAESFLQILITMLRRDAKFRHARYPETSVPETEADEDTDTATLQETWDTWIHQESFKRLVFRVFQHDTASSIALLVNPLISYAEVSLPFPFSFSLWAASTPDAWKSLLHTHVNTTCANLTTYLEDPEQFSPGGTFSRTVDTTVVRLAFVSWIWRSAWESIQLDSFMQRCSPSNTITQRQSRNRNTLLPTPSSRLDDLKRIISRFQLLGPHPPLTAHQDTTLATTVHLHIQTTLLHLHAPLEQLHLLSGIEGHARANEVHISLRQAENGWVHSESARIGICHAGRILKVARGLPAGMVLGIRAVMVFQAGLVLWGYGILKSKGEEKGGGGEEKGDGGEGGEDEVDDEDGLQLERFRVLGRGKPYIRGPVCETQSDEELVDVGRPADVMDVVIGVMKGNHEGVPRPPLVDSLIRLVMEMKWWDGDCGAS